MAAPEDSENGVVLSMLKSINETVNVLKNRPVNLWERLPCRFLKIILENPVDFFAAIKSDINAQKSDIDTQKNIANEKVSYKTVYPHFRF